MNFVKRHTANSSPGGRGTLWLHRLPAFVAAARTLVFTCVSSYAAARLSYINSVCPSVTRWYCIKTAERIVMLSSPHDSPFILVLCASRSSPNSDGVTPWPMWGR